MKKIYCHKALVLGGVVVALACSAATPLRADSILNGSFETGPGVSSFVALGAGDTSISGWTVGGQGIDYIGSYWVAQDGNRSLDLNALGPGSISQTFATDVNQHYRVSFWLAANPDSTSPNPRTGSISAGAGSDTFSFTLTGAEAKWDMKWVEKSFDFFATSTSTTLTFTSTSTADSGVPGYPYAFGPALDNVSVAAVPLPSAALAGGAVLGAMAIFHTIRRRAFRG